MDDNNQGKGWHGDSERHAEVGREKKKTNWWPLLLLPIAFFIGWGANDAASNNDRSQATENQQYGIGGGPGNNPNP